MCQPPYHPYSFFGHVVVEYRACVKYRVGHIRRPATLEKALGAKGVARNGTRLAKAKTLRAADISNAYWRVGGVESNRR